ncbi:MAG: sugar phosphate isomerase/epimerase [Clostridiaceae bacterium]|jgi:sugar phosphate isomerase/epimerase|nr:sugar phosphate isomerase/epimerase [Clostridiaceae bacterium]
MADFKIGVIIDSFRLGTDDGIRKAREVGADGIQIYATHGEVSPENLNAAQRRELLDKIKSQGLVVSALCGDLGGHGFMDAEDNPRRIEKSKRIMELAKDLETDVVTTHIGVVPPDPAHPRYKVLQDACIALARFGDEVGATFAIETGPETAAVLRRFIDSLGAAGVRVNLDPANFVMVTGDDPVQAVKTLAPFIVHTHAKDGIRLLEQDPEITYGMIEASIERSEAFREVPLGQGSVHFPTYLKALDEIGFHGFLTIEREVGDDPARDIRLAVDFLREHIRQMNKA